MALSKMGIRIALQRAGANVERIGWLSQYSESFMTAEFVLEDMRKRAGRMARAYSNPNFRATDEVPGEREFVRVVFELLSEQVG